MDWCRTVEDMPLRHTKIGAGSAAPARSWFLLMGTIGGVVAGSVVGGLVYGTIKSGALVGGAVGLGGTWILTRNPS